MSTVMSPGSVAEALEMVHAGLGYLTAADAAQLPVATQADCLRGLERSDAAVTAARASFLSAFTAGQGYSDDADYSALAWLMHRTGITRGAAVGHTAWAKRVATHPREVPGRVRRTPAGGRGRRAGPAGAGRDGRRDVRAGPRRPGR